MTSIGVIRPNFVLILIITDNVIDVQKSYFSFCAGYLAMGNGLFCILLKTKQQNNKHIKITHAKKQ